MNWVYLVLAGCFEIIWAVGLKYSMNFTKLFPTIITIAAMILSILFLGTSLKGIPLGTAYAVWTGIGIIGSVICGVIFFSEPLGVMKIIFSLFIVLGIIGLKIIA